MRHASCVMGVLCLMAVVGPVGWAHSPVPLAPGDRGFFGAEWISEGVVQITPLGFEVEHWVDVQVFGKGLEFGFTDGPFRYEPVPFKLAIALPVDANAPGLAMVYVRVDAYDVRSGVALGNQQAPARYVADAGLPTERWVDAAAAELTAVRVAPLEAGFVEEGLVGLEVAP